MTLAAVFDVDGTLVSFEFDVMGTREALLEALEARGFDLTGLGPTTPTQQILDSAERQVAQGSIAANLNELRNAAYAILDEFELKTAPAAMAFPETIPTLEKLRNGGVRLAVLTNSGRKAAFEVLRRAGILGLFEFVLTRDDIVTMKPRPEGLDLAVKMLGLSKDAVFYVGDSPYDIAAAKGAGVKVVSVATGNYDRERLTREGADFVLASIGELPSILGA